MFLQLQKEGNNENSRCWICKSHSRTAEIKADIAILTGKIARKEARLQRSERRVRHLKR